LPPLRERQEDIPYLANYFLEIHSERNRRRFRGINEQAMSLLVNYAWPGNIRELENAIERAGTLSDGPWITPRDLPLEVTERGLPLLTDGHASQPFPDNLTLEELEARYIRHVLQKEGGNQTRAAQILGISRSTLWRKIRRYRIGDVSF
jgi:two-component system response regulator HydG